MEQQEPTFYEDNQDEFIKLTEQIAKFMKKKSKKEMKIWTKKKNNVFLWKCFEYFLPIYMKYDDEYREILQIPLRKISPSLESTLSIKVLKGYEIFDKHFYPDYIKFLTTHNIKIDKNKYKLSRDEAVRLTQMQIVELKKMDKIGKELTNVSWEAFFYTALVEKFLNVNLYSMDLLSIINNSRGFPHEEYVMYRDKWWIVVKAQYGDFIQELKKHPNVGNAFEEYPDFFKIFVQWIDISYTIDGNNTTNLIPREGEDKWNIKIFDGLFKQYLKDYIRELEKDPLVVARAARGLRPSHQDEIERVARKKKRREYIQREWSIDNLDPKEIKKLEERWKKYFHRDEIKDLENSKFKIYVYYEMDKRIANFKEKNSQIKISENVLIPKIYEQKQLLMEEMEDEFGMSEAIEERTARFRMIFNRFEELNEWTKKIEKATIFFLRENSTKLKTNIEMIKNELAEMQRGQEKEVKKFKKQLTILKTMKDKLGDERYENEIYNKYGGIIVYLEKFKEIIRAKYPIIETYIDGSESETSTYESEYINRLEYMRDIEAMGDQPTLAEMDELSDKKPLIATVVADEKPLIATVVEETEKKMTKSQEEKSQEEEDAELIKLFEKDPSSIFTKTKSKNKKNKKKKKGNTSPSSGEKEPVMTGFLTVEQLKKNQEEDRKREEEERRKRKEWEAEQERLKSQKREKIKQPEGGFLETELLQEFLGMKKNTIEEFKSSISDKIPEEIEKIIMWDSILSVLIDLEYDVLQNLEEPVMGILGGGFAAHLLTKDVEGGPYPTDDIDIKIYPAKKQDKNIVKIAREKMYEYLEAKPIAIQNPQRGQKADEIMKKINSKMKRYYDDGKQFIKDVMISYMYSLEGELASLQKKLKLLGVEIKGDGRKNGYVPPKREPEAERELKDLYKKTMLEIDAKQKELIKDKDRKTGLYVIKIAVDINRKYKFIETFPYSKDVYYKTEFNTERKAVCDIGFWKDDHMIPSIMGLLRGQRKAGGYIHDYKKPWLPFHEYKYRGKDINLPIIHKDNLIEEKKVLVKDKHSLFNSQEAIEHKTPNWDLQLELLENLASKKKGGRTLKRRRKKKETRRRRNKKVKTKKKRKKKERRRRRKKKRKKSRKKRKKRRRRTRK
ncbi:MAG: hypothetical protein H8E55_65460 [Pelagibacterales bacterium]|nr:hypothetical protein [Pelagibacterales bacterium]